MDISTTHAKQHCCELMDINLADERVQIFYDPKFRLYYIPIHITGMRKPLLYCPWCNKKLPSILNEKYFGTLEKEYGMDFYRRDKKSLPKEFETDEWWKKRDL